jgi:tetratricopeptide (TPR) repeat protein
MRGDAQQTINFARRVVELTPTDLGARKSLIDQLVAFGKAESAIEEYIHLAEAYYAQADLSQARKTYQEALRIGQQMNVDRSLRVKILYRMADIDTQSLEWRQALRILEQARTLQPDDPNARNQIIALNFRLSQEATALAELDNYIAYLGGSNRQTQLIQYLETLSADYPERIPVRRRLVDAYRQAGRIADAVRQLDSIGETFLQSGDRAAAIQTVEMIISLNPPNRHEYLQLLEQLRGDS